MQAHGCRISAIGVLATDQYDVLLILQALRQYFPHVCFFTFDLDAGMSYASAYKYTRNLLVASHFGLQLHPVLQGDVAPFRDSYQTSAFFSTLFALNFRDIKAIGFEPNRQGKPKVWNPNVEVGTRDRNSAYLEALVFEIGRNGPYQLTVTNGNVPSRHSDDGNDDPTTVERELPFSRIQSISPRERLGTSRSPFRFIGVPLVFGVFGIIIGLYFDPTRKKMFSVFGLGPLRQRIEDRKYGTAAILFAGRLVLVLVPPLVIARLILRAHHSEQGEPFSLTEGISAWPTMMLLFAATALGLYRVLRRLPVFGDTEGLQHRLWRLTFPKKRPQPETPSFRASVKSWLDEVSLDHWSAIHARPMPNIGTFMKDFYRKASPWPQLIRAAVLTVLLVLYACLIWELMDSVRIGVRHWSLRWLIDVLTACAYFLSFFLTAMVIDSTRLCCLLSKRLGRGTAGWPTLLPELAPAKANYRDQGEATAVKSVQMIAEGTELVSRSIWGLGLVYFLLFAAHYPYFEYYSVPWFTILTLAPLVIGVAISTITMRVEAGKARTQLLKRLQYRALATDIKHHPNSEEALGAIMAENRGAFRPIGRDPLIQVLAIPFGGTTGLILLEQALRLISG